MINERYFCYSPNLLFHGMQTFIFDTLRSKNANDFMVKFGGIFERYVEQCISYTNVPYLTEMDLKKFFGEKGKLVDFLVVDSNSNIFIDAKGVEIEYLGMVTHQPEIVRHRTKDSILKGIRQGYETAHRLDNVEQIGEVPLGKINNFLIIVTFKDCYVGNGTDFYESIAKREVDSIIQEFGNIQWIPLENMYFMSIDDFDLFVEGIKANQFGPVEILQKAVKDDRDYQTKKFLFRQHVTELCPNLPPPKYLNDEFDRLFGKFKTNVFHKD